MPGALLDTSILIAPAGAASLPPSAAISVITVGELRAGVALARSEAVREQREVRLSAIRAAFEPLPVDEAVADAYGELLAVARCQRRITKASDLLIVATARCAGRTLYTLDASQSRLAVAAGIATSAD